MTPGPDDSTDERTPDTGEFPDERIPPEPVGDRDGQDTGEEWQFPVEEVPESADEDGESNVAGTLMRDEPLEPETIDIENAVFFLLGSLGTILFVVLAILGI